jgi:hypothetical protein
VAQSRLGKTRAPDRRGLAALIAALALVFGACGGSPAITQQPHSQPSLPPPGGHQTADPNTSLPPGATPEASPDPMPEATPGEASPTAQGPLPVRTPGATRPAATPVGLADASLAWTQLALADGPSAREDHTLTVDEMGDGAYLFGGRAGRRAFDDLWRYDLVADRWELLDPAGDRPEARFGHVAAWVEGLGLVIWSGQQSARVFFGDIWAYDPDAGEWQQLPDGGEVPEARYGSCGAIGPDGRLWISHGFTEDSGRFFDTRAYDFETSSWSDETPAGDLPVVRCLHRCLWTPDGDFVLYAGQTTGAPAIGDLWRYDPGAGDWSQAERPAAASRQLYSIAQLDGGTAVIFGGGGANAELLDDLWLLDLGSLGMRAADVQGEGPAGRFGASLIADQTRDRLLLFGGKGEAGELADLWELAPAES